MRVWSAEEVSEFENFCLDVYKERLTIISDVNALYFYSELYDDFRRDIAAYICEHKSYDLYVYDGKSLILRFYN